MPSHPLSFARAVVRDLRHALSGPQGLAFLPAITLTAFWLGGEVLLLTVALAVPGLIAAASLMIRTGNGDRGFDRLTGLPLRPRFEVEIDELIANSASGRSATACLAIGLDDHARLVTRMGRDAADNVVSGVADRVLSTLRDSDMVARVDDSVLAVALSPGRRTDPETLIRIASRIQAALTEPFSVDGVKVFVSASIGIAPPSRLDRPSGARLMEAAEIALAAARLETSGAVRTYSDTMTPVPSQSREGATDLAAALDGGAFEPWYQPVVDMRTGALNGFEALARWHHPDRGVLRPEDFMDELVRAGLSQRLTEVMLYASCTRLAAWDQTGVDVPRIWLNLAQEDLLNPKLPEKFEKQFKRFDLGGERFGFDVTEGVLRGTTETLIGRNLRALSRLGCMITLDQFGASPVSILELRRFSIDTVRIDRTVTKGIDRNGDQQALFAACLGVADRLGLKTIAVGVETASEHARAAELGCNAVQGALVAAAMPSDHVQEWITRSRAEFNVTPLERPAKTRKGIG